MGGLLAARGAACRSPWRLPACDAWQTAGGSLCIHPRVAMVAPAVVDGRSGSRQQQRPRGAGTMTPAHQRPTRPVRQLNPPCHPLWSAAAAARRPRPYHSRSKCAFARSSVQLNLFVRPPLWPCSKRFEKLKVSRVEPQRSRSAASWAVGAAGSMRHRQQHTGAGAGPYAACCSAPALALPLPALPAFSPPPPPSCCCRTAESST